MNCEKAKQKISIRVVLESFYLFPVKDNNRTAFYFAIDREERTPSLSVEFIKNKAFDFGTGKSYDVISIVQQINQCSVSDALKYLEKFEFSMNNEIHSFEPNKDKTYEILKVIEIQNCALIQYLTSRKVYQQKELVREVHFKIEGKKYFGVGFFNNSGGVEIRNKYFKICLGKKDVTWVRTQKSESDEITVFEGFFDYLTYRNMKKEQNSNSLILNSTSMFFRVENELKKYNKISLFLDNDSNGKSVTAKMISQYKNVEDCSLIYNGFKDLNGWYCERK